MTLNLHHNFVLGGWVASESTEVLSAFLAIDTVGVCPPEHVLVPAIGLLVVLLLSKIAIMVNKRLS